MMKAKHIYEILDFERGKDPKRTIDVGMSRMVKKGDIKQITYKGSAGETRINAMALEDEYTEYNKTFIDFVDEEGDKGWALKDPETGEWKVPSSAETYAEIKTIGESLGFERGLNPKNSIGIGLIKTITAEMLADVNDEKWWNKYGTHIAELLIWSVEKDNAEYVRYLLDNGAKVFVNIDDDGPLRTAVLHNNPQIVRMLLDAGANPKTYNNYLINHGGHEVIAEYKNWRKSKDKRRKENRNVSEAIDFERGKDPKESMGLGAIELLQKQWEDVQQSNGTGSMEIKQDNDLLYLRIYVTKWPESNHQNRLTVESIMGTEYFDSTRSYQGGSYNYYSIKPEYQDLFIKTYNKIYPAWPFKKKTRVKESLDFERGKDPIEALKVGMRNRALEISGVFDDNDQIIPYDNAVKILENMDFMVVRHNYVHYYPEGGGISRYSIKYLMSENQDQYDYILFEGNYYPIPGKNNDFFGKRTRVSESLDFERGIDPKRSMRIGLPDFKMISYWANKFGFNEDGKTEDSDIFSWSKPGVGSIHYSKWPEGMIIEVGDYMIVSELDADDPDYNHWETSEWTNPETWLHTFGDILINENINFKRGIEPKSSLGLGLENIIYDKLDQVLKEPNIGSVSIEKPHKGGKAYLVIRAWEQPIMKKVYDKVESYFGDYITDDYFGKGGEIFIHLKPGYEKYFIRAWNMRYPRWKMDESINFKRGMDPKDSLSIGIFSNRTFDNEWVASEFIIEHLPQILGTDEIPEDIIQELHGPCPYPTYEQNCPTWYKISRYIRKYISLRTDSGNDDIDIEKSLATKLEYSLGFKRQIFKTNENINFERGIDPKNIMDIGMKKQVPILFEKLLRYDWNEGFNFILDIKTSPDGDSIEILCDNTDRSRKEEVAYIKDLFKKFNLEKIVDISGKVKSQIGMGINRYYFWLTKTGEDLRLINMRYWISNRKDQSFEFEKSPPDSFTFFPKKSFGE